MGVPSPTALVAYGCSLNTESSKRLEEPRSGGKAASRDQRRALWEAPWSSLHGGRNVLEQNPEVSRSSSWGSNHHELIHKAHVS